MSLRIPHVDDDPGEGQAVERTFAVDPTSRCQALDALCDDFPQRLRADAIKLGKLQEALGRDPLSALVLQELQSCAHKLAGAAGVFGYAAVSCAASMLEGSIIDGRRGGATPDELEAHLRTLLVCIECE